MKFPRKHKKQIIKLFGFGTYMGIIKGYLIIQRTKDNKGTIIRWSGKQYKTEFYNSGQYHPYIKV